MSALAIVKAYIDAWNTKDVERMLGMFTDDAVMSSAMGPQKGKTQIRSATTMMLAMTSKQKMTDPYEDNGNICAKIKAPVGMVTLFFSLQSDLIHRIDAKIGLR